MKEIVEERMEGTPSSRRWGLSKRRLVLEEHLDLGVSISSLARKYGIHPVTIYSWKRDHMKKVEHKKNEPSSAELLEELARIQKENKNLKKALADVCVDKAILTDIVEVYKKKYLQQQKSKSAKRSK